MKRPMIFGCFVLALSTVSNAQDKEDKSAILKALKSRVERHMTSYATDHRSTVSMFGEGKWVRSWYDLDPAYSFDVQSTNSIVSPYTGFVEFTLTMNLSDAFPTREEVPQDAPKTRSRLAKHKHVYAYQDGQWVSTSRQHFDLTLGKWFDCNEVIESGANKGNTDLFGCFEPPAPPPPAKSKPAPRRKSK